MTAARQLTYTSVDALDGSLGGWQVKDRSPDLTEAEEQALLALAATRLDFVQPPPRFPSASEIAALPPRLVTAYDDGRPLLVHTAAAGNDASGRPGNVFTHALVVDDAQTRPLQWWRSPGWLRPYGADAVRECRLGPPPAVGTTVTVASVADFLGRCSPHGLGALLDAVAACIGSEKRVVLVEDDLETAVQWLATVSFLTPAGSQSWMSVSTFERAYALPPVTVSVIGTSDVSQLPLDSDLLVVDPATQTPAADGRWTLSRGTVNVTLWSLLAQSLAQTPDRAERLLLLDQHALANPRAAGRHLEWALAAALLDVAPDQAMTALLAAMSYVDEPALQAAVREAFVSRAGETPDETAAYLARLRAAGGAWSDEQLAVYAHWVGLAVYDDTTLLGDWPPLLADLGADASLRAEVAESIRVAITELADEELDTTTHSVLALRLFDLAQRLGLAELVGADVVRPDEIALFLPGQHGPAIAEQAGDLAPETLALLDVPEALRDRLSPEVEAWLAAGRPAPVLVPAPPLEAPALEAPVLEAPALEAPAHEAGIAQRPSLDPVEAERLLSQVFALGSPDALDLAYAVHDDHPDTLRYLARVHRAFTGDWWTAGRERAAEEAQTLMQGLTLLARLRKGQFTVQLERHLLALVVRAEAWWDSPEPVPSLVRQKLRLMQDPLLGLVQPLNTVTRPTADMLLVHDDLARHLGRIACGQAVRSFGAHHVLVDVLFPEDHEKLPVKRVAAGLLRTAALMTDDPETWIRNRSPLGPDAPPDKDLLTLVNLSGAPVT